jgi:hypothetical protein
MYYAEIDADNIVIQVIVADADFIAKQPGRWVRACKEGKASKNYAPIGHKYNEANNSFDYTTFQTFSKVVPYRDENGKQLYYKLVSGEHKSQVEKVPLQQRVYYLRCRVTQKVIKSKRQPEIIYPEQEE